MKDFKPEVPPDWCPGCGDFGVLNALFQACAELDLPPRDLLVVSGIGCSSNLPGFFRSYGVHSLHGRALPFATGAKLANHGMTVIATGGDGDGYGIGLNHFIQAMRRNIDMTYIVMNNEIYGLTTGQVSPTSETGMKTKTTPHGNLEGMLNPMALALASGCGYIARGFSGQPKHLMKLYVDGIRHPGFALIDVFSPCVTFNKLQHLRLVPPTGVQAGRRRTTIRRTSTARWTGPSNGARRFRSGSSTATRTRRRASTRRIPGSSRACWFVSRWVRPQNSGGNVLRSSCKQ